MIKTNIELVDTLKNVVSNYKTLYVMGCFGAPMTVANKKRYTTNHTYNKAAARTAMINAASDDTFGFDCVCLIKGLLWGWCGDKSKAYGGATYISNGVPDISADGMIAKCSNVSTTGWDTMEIGEAVWLSGHIGIYAGNGVVIECSPSFKNCVQETACLNIKAIAGMNGRRWTKHGKLPYITYASVPNQEPTIPNSTSSAGINIAVGSVVNFCGNQHYTSSNATSGKTCRHGSAKVTAIANGAKHPYHLIHIDSTSNVYGWVDAADITDINSSSTTTPTTVSKTHTVVKGDSLSALASKYGTTINKIVEANRTRYPNITSNYIVIGWTLIIP